MDFERNLHIPELYDLKHRHDNNLNAGFNYKDNVLKNSLSKNIFKNDISNTFLLKLQELISLTIDSNVIIRNWFNHTISRYYDKHSN